MEQVNDDSHEPDNDLVILEPKLSNCGLTRAFLYPIQLICVAVFVSLFVLGYPVSFYICYRVGRYLVERGRAIACDDYSSWLGLELVKFCLVIYLTYRYVQHFLADWRVERRGGRFNRWLRNLVLWRYAASYFPVRLVASRELLAYARRHQRPLNDLLPPNQNYLAGCHPHGIFSVGTDFNFLTDATEVCRSMFASLRPRPVTLEFYFRIPFFRELLIELGAISSSKHAIRYALSEDQSPASSSNMVVVIVGGAREALNACPGNYKLILERRTGFFQLALETGSSLIPCLSFGETALYNQIGTDESSFIRKIQNLLVKTISKVAPIIYGVGLLPYQRPVSTVVGAPISVKQTNNPTPDEIAAVKKEYIESLRHLFETYKDRFDPLATEMIIS